MSQPPHDWLRSVRCRQYLRQIDLERRITALGSRIHASDLSRLERGHLPLTHLRADQVEALCHVLNITPQEWSAHVSSSEDQPREGSQ